jgi:hypothetical protein
MKPEMSPTLPLPPLPPYHDEPLAIVHLLGGRYGYQPDDRLSMPEQVAQAIAVFTEIRRQLHERDSKSV